MESLLEAMPHLPKCVGWTKGWGDSDFLVISKSSERALQGHMISESSKRGLMIAGHLLLRGSQIFGKKLGILEDLKGSIWKPTKGVSYLIREKSSEILLPRAKLTKNRALLVKKSKDLLFYSLLNIAEPGPMTSLELYAYVRGVDWRCP